MQVELEIGTLLFDGFPQVDFERVAAAFRVELTRLIGERGVPGTLLESMQEESIVLDPLMLPRGAGPEAIGVYLAQSLYERLRSSVNETALPEV